MTIITLGPGITVGPGISIDVDATGGANIVVTPTYTLSRSTVSVNEGSSFTITFNTNQNGSFPYTITGVSSADIGGASLTGTVINGNILTFNVTADTLTEGTETFTIALDNGQASTNVTINDTSLTPPPDSLTNLEVWYDASRSNTTTFNNGIITSGTEITSWHNFGNLPSHDWNSTGGSRPEWFSNIKNGLGVVRFNNSTAGSPTGEDADTDENLTINPVTYIQNLSGSCLVLVFRSLSTAAGTRYCSSTDVGGFQFGQNGTQWIGGFAGATYSISGVTADTNFHYVIINFDGTQTGNTNRLKVRLDSADASLSFTGTVNAATSGTAKYFYGGATGTSSSNQTNFWIGDIGELLIYTRTLNNTEITQVENYIKSKWAL